MDFDQTTFENSFTKFVAQFLEFKEFFLHPQSFLVWESPLLDYFDSTAGLFCCGRLWYWTILMLAILLLDFFAVGDSDAGLSSHWTNELHSQILADQLILI